MTSLKVEVPRHELAKLRRCWNHLERKFDNKYADNALRRILNKGIDPVLQRTRALAPTDTGLLKKSIVKRTGRDKEGVFAIVYVSKSRGRSISSRANFNAGGDRQYASWYQVIAQEYGTIYTPERRFLRGGMEQGREAALRVIEMEMGAEMDKSVSEAYNTIGSRGRK